MGFDNRRENWKDGTGTRFGNEDSSREYFDGRIENNEVLGEYQSADNKRYFVRVSPEGEVSFN